MFAEIQAVSEKKSTKSGSPKRRLQQNIVSAEVLPPEEAAAAGLNTGEVPLYFGAAFGRLRCGYWSDRKPGRKRIRWLAQLLKRSPDSLVDMHGTRLFWYVFDFCEFFSCEWNNAHEVYVIFWLTPADSKRERKARKPSSRVLFLVIIFESHKRPCVNDKPQHQDISFQASTQSRFHASALGATCQSSTVKKFFTTKQSFGVYLQKLCLHISLVSGENHADDRGNEHWHALKQPYRELNMESSNFWMIGQGSTCKLFLLASCVPVACLGGKVSKSMTHATDAV